MVIAIFGIILLLAFLPRIIEALGALQSEDKTQEQITEEKETEIKRQEKGALANTVDFIFGEGIAEDLKLTNPPKEDDIIENLNKSATEALGRKVTFDPSTTITKEGIIEADRPPTFEATAEDLIALQNKRQKQNRKSELFVSG